MKYGRSFVHDILYGRQYPHVSPVYLLICH